MAKDNAEAALRITKFAEDKNRGKSIFLIGALKELKQTRYYLTEKHKRIHITLREARCLLSLAGKQTAKETGKILNLSYITVETHWIMLNLRLTVQKN